MFADLTLYGDEWWLALQPLLFATSLALIFPVLFLGWWSSFRIGSCLARDETTRVISAARTTDPDDDAAWKQLVSEPALQLDAVFVKVSTGWSPGLLGMILFFWLSALSSLAGTMNNPYIAAWDKTQELGYVQTAIVRGACGRQSLLLRLLC